MEPSYSHREPFPDTDQTCRCDGHFRQQNCYARMMAVVCHFQPCLLADLGAGYIYINLCAFQILIFHQWLVQVLRGISSVAIRARLLCKRSACYSALLVVFFFFFGCCRQLRARVIRNQLQPTPRSIGLFLSLISKQHNCRKGLVTKRRGRAGFFFN